MLTVVCAAPVFCGNEVGRTEGTDFNHLVVQCLAKGPVLVWDNYGKLRIEGMKRRDNR